MILSKPILLAKRVARNLAARVLFGAALALAMAALSPLILPLVPDGWRDRIDSDAVIPILSILATTMLTVTTFSLSVMVQAFQTAASQATPRAYRMQLSDTTTQTVLATFTAAFLYSLTALVMFRARIYAEEDAVVILGVTILVIGAIVLAILRWIDHLSTLGSLDDTLEKVEAQAREPLRLAMRRPALGALPLAPGATLPERAQPLPAPCGGYLQFIDMDKLHGALAERGARLTLTCGPGTHTVAGAPLGWILGAVEDPECLNACFTIGPIRTPEQDARFGIIVMNEIAVRALSPSVNDPGTAIDVLHRLTRLLSDCGAPDTAPPQYPRIELPAVTGADLIEDGFASLIRAGASQPEVIGTAMDSLAVLQSSCWPELRRAAGAARGYAMRHAEQHLTVEDDRAALARKAQISPAPDPAPESPEEGA